MPENVTDFSKLCTEDHHLNWVPLGVPLFQTQNEIRRAMEEDPTVYEYDNVYDEMTAKKKAAHVKVPEKDRKVISRSNPNSD